MGFNYFGAIITFRFRINLFFNYIQSNFKSARREFFVNNPLIEIFKSSVASQPAKPSPAIDRDYDWYFKSELYSYPLLQELPWELMLAEAEKRGIPIKGRHKHEIAKDLILSTQASEHIRD
ncbi:hypothetical protein SOV_32370 [Sporomusa ovata DSM 2662]|uniref:hypothetical protein n=1 Tax=Sporomusa ovata TaxID=2378 RepID=UPI0003887457|nr:hypothetical protein [Sporomusa ovata]EQB25192.1 hypothetical protein SOV_5c03420 [Sporomusa ovata DSM 2662]